MYDNNRYFIITTLGSLWNKNGFYLKIEYGFTQTINFRDFTFMIKVNNSIHNKALFWPKIIKALF
jgi:hypothetical protein